MLSIEIQHSLRERGFRLTRKACAALNFAEEEAVNFRNGYVGSEHLLLGLVRAGSSRQLKKLRANGINELRSNIALMTGYGLTKVPYPLHLTPGFWRVVDGAADEAIEFDRPSVTIERLARSMFRQELGFAAAALETMSLRQSTLTNLVSAEFATHR